MHTGVRVPDVTFKTRVREESVGGSNPFCWQDMSTADDFAGKRVGLFSLRGARAPETVPDWLRGSKAVATAAE